MSSFGEDGRSIDSVNSIHDYTRRTVSREELEDIEHFKPLLNWWRQETQAKQHLPSRKDFNPAEFPAILPHIAIFEPIFKDGELTDCRTVLIGTELTKVYGEATGELASQINNEYVVQTVLSSVGECIRTLQPVGIKSKAVSKELPFLRSYALYCPLATDHSHIDKILVHVAFDKVES